MVAATAAIRACEPRDLQHFDRLGSALHVEHCRTEYARGTDALAILVAVDGDDVPVAKVHLDFAERAGERIAVLRAAAVAPPLQGRGIGTALMQAAEAVTCGRGFHAIVLGFEDANAAARRLYERLGYDALAAGDFRYTGATTPNPGVWMRKDLQC